MKKNKRSKLHLMQRKYFWNVVGCFLAYFLVLFLVCEIFFMITEAIPTIRLVVILFLLGSDIFFTRRILNTDLKRWLRPELQISFEKKPQTGYNTPKDVERKEYQKDKTGRESVVGENRQRVTEKSSGSSLGEQKEVAQSVTTR